MSTRGERPNQGGEAAPGRRLTLLYIFALSTVAMLSLGAQWLIQRQLSSGESDSRVINIAGRQRMLSQRIAKASLKLEGSVEGADAQSNEELATAVELWSQSHEGLQSGDSALRLPGGNSEEVSQLFAVIEPHYQAMRGAALLAMDSNIDSESRAEQIAIIQRNELAFLKGMDAIVSQYVVEAEQKVARLQRLEWIILGLTLSVLLAEGMLIFRPAVRRIERTVARLTTMGERLRLAKEEAERANAAKTRFLGNVSHELRTPLTAILGMTDLARTSDDEEQRSAYLSIVEEAGESLQGLLNDLIDLSKIDAGKLEIHETLFDPQAVIARVARVMQVAAHEKGLDLVVNAGPDPSMLVRGDERRIEQVLLNLIANAIKSTPSGRITVGCTAGAAQDGCVPLSFSVYDTGSGIEPEDQQRIFEPFTQLSGGSSQPQGGAGLGLAICQKIAEALGAKITLLSTPGIGTTMTLSGPFAIAGPDAAPPAKTPEPTRTAPVKVLVVEDTLVNQTLIKDILEQAGHGVTIATSGEYAVDKSREEEFPITILDLYLPGIDGLATANELRRIEAETGRTRSVLVCLTAQSLDEEQAQAFAKSFDAVVQKPIRRRALLQLIADQCGGETLEAPAEALAADDAIDENLLQELAEAYLRVSPAQRRELGLAVKSRSFEEVRRLAHRVRSQVGYFDAAVLDRRLEELEQAARQGDAGAMREAHTIIAPLLEELESKLKPTPV